MPTTPKLTFVPGTRASGAVDDKVMLVKRGRDTVYEVRIDHEGVLVRACAPVTPQHDGFLVMEPQSANTVRVTQAKGRQ